MTISDVRSIIEKKDEANAIKIGIAKSHGVRAIPELLKMLENDDFELTVLSALAEFSLAERIKHIHPMVTKLAAEHLCAKEKYVGLADESLMELLIKDAKETPTVSERLIAAIGRREIRFPQQLHIFIAETRTPLALPLIAKRPKWASSLYTILLWPELVPILKKELADDLSGGEDTVVALAALGECKTEIRAAFDKAKAEDRAWLARGLAFFADAADAERFNQKGVTKETKAIHQGLTQGDSQKRVEALGRWEEPKSFEWAALLADPDNSIVAFALDKLKDELNSPWASFHGMFLLRVGACIQNGRSAAELKLLGKLNALIPLAPPLPKASAKKPPVVQKVGRALAAQCKELAVVMEKVGRYLMQEEQAAAFPRGKTERRADGIVVTAGFGDSYFVDGNGNVIIRGEKKTLAEIIKERQQQLITLEAMFAQIRRLADVMTKQVTLRNQRGLVRYFDGRPAAVHRDHTKIDVIHKALKSLTVLRATGCVHRWEGYGTQQVGKKIYANLDAAIADIEAQNRAMEQPRVRANRRESRRQRARANDDSNSKLGRPQSSGRSISKRVT